MTDAASLRSRIEAALTQTRATTLNLIAPLDDTVLHVQHSSLMSPLVWDLGHIANFEALWLLKRLGLSHTPNPKLDAIYDPFVNPRSVRAELELLHRKEVLSYLEGIRAHVLEFLHRCEFPADDPLLRDGYVYWMIVQHETQHQETMLQSLDLHPALAPYPPAARGAAPARAQAPQVARINDVGRVEIDTTEVTIGTMDRASAYDNERPRHRRHVVPFELDRYPVTCRRYAAFIAESGYLRSELWSTDGWAWRNETNTHAPQGWYGADSEGWRLHRFGYDEPLDMDAPVQHVSFYEAEAFARWADARLPSELEWEVAAQASDIACANVGFARFAPVAIGSDPSGASKWGAEQMLGDVYEWTSSPFTGYPGFESFPYTEYSEVFFGTEYRVLRGASWATSSHCARLSFRNWDFPIRRQIFAGFRLAHDH